MLEFGLGLMILLGVGAISFPLFKRADRKRTEARLSYLTTRLSANTSQLAKTTASKFPTDYQRLQQQVSLDSAELSKLLRSKERALSLEVTQLAWDLIEESSEFLPTKATVTRPERLELEGDAPLLTSGHLKKVVPELWPTLENIQKDDAEIRQKIVSKKLPNQLELLAVHDANMARYQDILEGYLKIKADPRAYYQAEERLLKSREALTSFDAQLDETLRQINENDMMDFEISLRMMNEKH